MFKSYKMDVEVKEGVRNKRKGGGKSDRRREDRERGLFDQCAKRKLLVPYHG